MIGREFFQRDPVSCARDLVGCRLVWGEMSGIVVETEAYDAEGDEACHTFFRPSAREFVSRHEAGAAYIYLNYGVHWMLNVLVRGEREGFVLVRALEPVGGLDAMRKRRKQVVDVELCSGPGKLTRALGIGPADHGVDLCGDAARAFYPGEPVARVCATPRIGITRAVELKWRFIAEGNPHVSGPKRKGRVGPKSHPA